MKMKRFLTGIPEAISRSVVELPQDVEREQRERGLTHKSPCKIDGLTTPKLPNNLLTTLPSHPSSSFELPSIVTDMNRRTYLS